MTSPLTSLKHRLFGDPTRCKHESLPRPTTTDAPSIWYRLDETRSDTYWVEYDVCFIQLREVTVTWYCVGCGETATIHSGERVGGRDGIEQKAELSTAERRRLAQDSTGARFNPMSFPLEVEP